MAKITIHSGSVIGILIGVILFACVFLTLQYEDSDVAPCRDHPELQICNGE